MQGPSVKQTSAIDKALKTSSERTRWTSSGAITVEQSAKRAEKSTTMPQAVDKGAGRLAETCNRVSADVKHPLGEKLF